MLLYTPTIALIRPLLSLQVFFYLGTLPVYLIPANHNDPLQKLALIIAHAPSTVFSNYLIIRFEIVPLLVHGYSVKATCSFM